MFTERVCFAFTGQKFTSEQLDMYHGEGLNSTLKYGEEKNELRTKNIHESVKSVLDIFDNKITKGLSLIKEICT